MRYISTRRNSPEATLSAAIEHGLAPDGGLYVPAEFPTVDADTLRSAGSLPELATGLLDPFFAGDPLEADLPAICADAFDFPAPLRDLPRQTAVLELFHGPTAAFKDFGARFLAATLSRIQRPDDRPLTVLVATSGDTGGAVAAAFAGRPGFRVIVLYPAGMVSERQERQLTCWGGNVHALRVAGDFDDCQRLAKEAFADPELRQDLRLTSANSISLGRLLPQMVYYADASIEYGRRHGVAPGFVIPSGNLGNATACFWAARVGLPVREIVLATNANDTLARFVADGVWRPGRTIQTLATAMDVGNPSNMERLVDLYSSHSAARDALRVFLVTDDEIREAIRSGLRDWGEVWDPHTATAVVARERIDSGHWILVSTAHPAKFERVVEPLVGRAVEVPPALAALLDRPMSFTPIGPNLAEFRRAIR